MINIDSLPTPSVLKNLDYETILQENLEYFRNLLPSWQPIDSDEFLIVLQAFSYRELYLRKEFNRNALAFFLATTSGDDLDNIALIYNLERLKGSFPYADYEFELSSPLSQDILISKNLILIDDNNFYEAVLKNDVIIEAGETKAIGLVELQLAISSSEIKTELISTPLPFLLKASAKNPFTNGSNKESDDSFKERILLSLSDKSTAGSEETYKSYALKADERIEDVKVINGGPGVVNVYYFSENSDEVMHNRIVSILNKKDVRPITDLVIVQEAVEVDFTITADLKIYENQETAHIYTNAINSLNKGLQTLKKIGVKVTISEINDFLRVPGVKEVVISFPTGNINIQNNEIGVCIAKNITYTII